MKNLLKLHGDKKSIVRLIQFLPLICFISMCSLSKERAPIKPPSLDTFQMSQVFEDLQIIGEGTDFLTIKCDMPQTLPPECHTYALVLDEDAYPLRKISSYTYDPRLKGRNHMWFYFFLYDPRKTPHFPKQSNYIKFIVVEGKNIEMEHTVKIQKTWGAKNKVKIFDLPSPPDNISGYLLLRDYTFLAKGDFRKPQGYYVEGTVAGHKGKWTHFIPLSAIQGEGEPGPEHVLSVDQGWLELTTGRTHSMKEAVAPQEPYVEGWWDGKGYFHPRPVKIHGLD